MFNAMMIRGVTELRSDANAPLAATSKITDVTVRENHIWVQTENGKSVPVEEYRSSRDRDESFLGFVVIFILDSEDVITHVRLSDVRLRHRIGIAHPKSDTDFILCVLSNTIETLPLVKPTLCAMLDYLQDVNPRGALWQLMRASCIRLIHASLYFYFDHASGRSLDHVPRPFLLFNEARKAHATVIAEAYFKTRTFQPTSITMGFLHRRTRDDTLVSDVVKESVNDKLKALRERRKQNCALPRR
ncbi:B103 [miniopterid betaherpesvirus 1]|uniref:B103 n=1 Tax=miniopterid betaherpesvirus 1 TaxID=3070189 RepID=I3VQ97_9BETA|nr:B103 [miniopterid betaherpesvirus 1]AFK83941.1 B103 [miniopterid betaherpesvirus 1]